MGRAFEYRKATKLKRWGNMARVFTKLGKQITIAVREGGPEPDTNPRLRVLMQQAKKENMPKENVERAIKKATDKDVSDYKEMVYEGYGPFGIAIVVETATDNPTRTVANVRSYFNKHGGSLGTSGSLEFLFDHKCVFRIAEKEGVSIEELELELIDYGVDELEVDEGEILLYGEFKSYTSRRTASRSIPPSSNGSRTTPRSWTRSNAPRSRSCSTNSRRTKMCRMCFTTWPKQLDPFPAM